MINRRRMAARATMLWINKVPGQDSERVVRLVPATTEARTPIHSWGERNMIVVERVAMITQEILATTLEVIPADT